MGKLFTLVMVGSLFILVLFGAGLRFSNSPRPTENVSNSQAPMPSVVGIRSELFGPVASGTIYTTLINLAELEPTLVSSTPYIVELSATGSLQYVESTVMSALDYQAHTPDLFSVGIFSGDTPIKQGWYELRTAAHGSIARLAVKSNPNTDVHGITYLQNGNFIIPSYKMHTRVTGSQLESFVIEEQTLAGQVVFSWDSIDHIDLTEADFIEQREWWIKNNINDYFHGNSVAEAVDGNLLISGRHTNSIIKIDRTSGAVLWRLGGTKSDFTFIDDPEGGFSHQHSVHQLPSGNILLYDNGNQNPRQISRVVEYAIDEVTKTARLVWSYSDGRFTYATGSVQRLKNGNTLIGWGLERDRQRATVPRITEVNQAGVVMMQIYFPDYSGLYNVFKS